MKKNFKVIITPIAILGMVLSTILLKHHLDHSYQSPLCGVGENNGCNVLNRSDVSEVFGIPLAYIGFVFYGFVALLGFYSDRLKSFVQTIFLLSVIALITDIGLLLYSVLVAETVCILCLFTYLVTIVIFTLSYLNISKDKDGYIPDFHEIQNQKVQMGQVLILLAAFIPVSGGLFYYSFASGTGGQVKNRGSYADHLAIAENEYIKAYVNAPEVHFRVDPGSKKGPVQGVVNIVEFADYLCPHCKIMAAELDRFTSRFPDEVSVTFRHYPLDQECNSAITRPFHQGACLLAYASYCATKQNKFWEIHRAIFERQAEFSKRPVSNEDVMNLAAVVGISKASMSVCLNEKETKQAILVDVQEANELGINGTPTIYIDGRKMEFNDFLLERLMMFKKNNGKRESVH